MPDTQRTKLNLPKIWPQASGNRFYATSGIDSDLDIQIQVAKPKLKKPRPYKVVLLNDDYTPMQFVVIVLQKFFDMNEVDAVHTMLSVHYNGSGVCGVFSYEIAEMKVRRVQDFSHQHSFPLQCTMEPE